MPGDISSTSLPNELAILTELMLSHPTMKWDHYFTIFYFLFYFFVFSVFFTLVFSLFFFTIDT